MKKIGGYSSETRRLHKDRINHCVSYIPLQDRADKPQRNGAERLYVPV